MNDVGLDSPVIRYEQPLLLLVLLAAFGAVIVLFRWRALPAVVTELSWLAAPAIVFATFAGIASIGASRADSLAGHDAEMAGQNLSQTRGPLREIPVPTDDRTSTSSADGKSPRPAWVDQPGTSDGLTEKIVVASQQYTTREEAELELTANTAEYLMRDLRQLHPGAGATTWRPKPEELKRVMVKEQYAEVIDRDFGAFFHPMYRVWWQVELSPEVRTEFLPAWKRGLTANRIYNVGYAATLLALAASLTAMNRRLSLLVRGSWRFVPQFLVVALVVVVALKLIYQMRIGI